MEQDPSQLETTPGVDGSKAAPSTKSAQDPQPKLPQPDDLPPLPDGNDPDASPDGSHCDDVEHKPCDANSQDPLHAIGINCPGEVPQIDASFAGPKQARTLLSRFGTGNAFAPREGQQYLVLGTGNTSNLTGQPADRPGTGGYACDADLGKKWDLPTLPAPMNIKPVGPKTCEQDPSLVGSGDCSNSIAKQWLAASVAGLGARDYNELRLKVKVPDWAKSLSYDFAFMTVEYPEYFKQAYNDFFIAWLESKNWTGNISFDKKGQPISLNAGFFDFKDSSRGVPNDPECLLGCDAQELHGTCLQEHAATKWLTTTVGVTPGEEIELVFAIVDLGDSNLDSFVFLDNFKWGCDEQLTPETDPPL